MAPSVFLIRHGQTEWSKARKYTGITDLSLTETGRHEATRIRTEFVGPGKLIDLSTTVQIFVSPRVRAKETFEPATENLPEAEGKATFDDRFREWDHGDYEGMTTEEIRASREGKGFDTSSQWSIWTGGCEGGESVQEITKRVESVIASIGEAQKGYMNEKDDGNVVIFGHGTFLRCLWKVWCGLPVSSPVNIKLDTGSVAILSYEDNDVNKRTVSIGHKVHPN